MWLLGALATLLCLALQDRIPSFHPETALFSTLRCARNFILGISTRPAVKFLARLYLEDNSSFSDGNYLAVLFLEMLYNTSSIVNTYGGNQRCLLKKLLTTGIDFERELL